MIRYKYVEKQLINLLNSIAPNQMDTLTFPINIVKIIQSIPNIRVWSYQYYSNFFSLSIKDVIVHCQSESGCTFYNPDDDTYLILFNRQVVQGRQRWTLAHELGHCILDHFEILKEVQIAENNTRTLVNDEFEKEADFFAATLLSPFQLYKHLGIQTSNDVKNAFALSVEASKNRYQSYIKWGNRHYKTVFDREIAKILKKYNKIS